MVKKKHTVHILLLACLLSTWGRYVQADPNGTDTQAYQEAYNHILEENWDKALTAFDTFIQQYKKSPYLDDAHFWHCFAMEKTGAADEDVFKCYQDLINAYPKSQWTDDAKRNLIAVGKKLSDMGKAEYGAIIEAMQGSVDKEIALTAISALRNIGSERALDALAGLYKSTQNRAVREEIIFTLSQFKSPKVVQSLTEIVKEDPNRYMREKALFWLGQKTQSEEVIKLMEHVVLNDPNHEVREKAVFALSQVREGKGIGALKRIAGEAKDAAVRRESVFWLGQQAKTNDVIQFLKTIVQKDSDPEVRERALHALAHARNNLGIPALIKLAESHPDKTVRKQAVFWVGQKAKSEEAIRCLENVALKDTDEEIRKTALLALSQAPEGGGVEALMKIGSTAKDAATRKEAVFWLGRRIKSDDVIKFLENVALEDTIDDIRNTALLALFQAPEGRGVVALMKVAGTAKDAETRKQAVFWLGQNAKSDDVMKFLETVVLKDADVEIRKTAILALSQARDERSLEVLMKIGSTAKDAATRMDAVFWIGRRAESADVIQFLEKVVREDSDPEVRKHALTALVHTPKNLGIPALINLAKSHPESEIRRDAIFWLGQSKDPRAMEALVEIVNEMK
jgi:HEAT repeat protein